MSFSTQDAGPPDLTVDVVVVGLGVGGEAVAGSLAKAGLEVLGIEAELVGGECPYWGCIPSKMIIRAANLLAEGRRIPGVAGESTVTPDWAPVAARIREEATDDWNDQVAVDRFTDAGGRFARGRAVVRSPRRVSVAGVGEVEARRGLVIATGTAAAIPPIDGLGETPYWTNRDVLSVEELPASLIILGGGAIGVEIGQALARFGVEVTVVEAAERLLPSEEPESSTLLAEVFADEGIEVLTGHPATRVTHDDGGFAVRVAGGSEIRAERLLVATGRRARVGADLLTALGLDPDRHTLPVTDRLQVVDGVWAVGDVVGEGAFTHVATYHADIVTAEILGNPIAATDYRALPRVTFTDPEIGSVGLTEAQAREQGLPVGIGIARVPRTSRGWIHKAGNAGVIKVVADTERRVLVGATSAGPTGGEVLGALAVAIHGRVPIDDLRRMIYAYPTFHRGIQDALRHLDLPGDSSS